MALSLEIVMPQLCSVSSTCHSIIARTTLPRKKESIFTFQLQVSGGGALASGGGALATYIAFTEIDSFFKLSKLHQLHVSAIAT